MADAEFDPDLGTTIKLDAYRPAYKQKCCVCGQSPVVKGVIGNRIAYDGEMCGPCTWGEVKMIDPEEWN